MGESSAISVNIHRHVRCEQIDATLAGRYLEANRDSYQKFVHLFFLTAGKAEALYRDQTTNLTPFTLIYSPANEAIALRLQPGSSGFLVGISSELLIEALGSGAESVLLREFSEHRSLVETGDDDRIDETYSIIIGLKQELADPARGSRMAVTAWVRLLLMNQWRLSGSHEASEQGHGEISTLLQRFRQLLELHFRERWTVREYADALAVNHDRLHAICTRTLEKTPSQLIQERVIFEARLRLERSGHSIQQLAHALGFPDSTSFSHYFKRYTGTTPAAFRKQRQNPHQRQQDTLAFGYADWP